MKTRWLLRVPFFGYLYEMSTDLNLEKTELEECIKEDVEKLKRSIERDAKSDVYWKARSRVLSNFDEKTEPECQPKILEDITYE